MEELRLLIYDVVGKLQNMQEEGLETMSLEDLSTSAFAIEKMSKSIVNIEQSVAKSATHSQAILPVHRRVKQEALNEAQAKISANAEHAGVSKATVETILKDVFNIKQ